MAETFRCPSCSAPLEFEGKAMQKCRFCGSSVIVPASTMQNAPFFGGAGFLDFDNLEGLTGKALKIAEIKRLLLNGNKIQAIKVFRETFGVGLKEAKDAVEAMERGESIDISGMQVHARQTKVVKMTPENVEAVKKIGYTVGGSILGSLIITVLVIGGVIALAFYLISNSINRAIEKPFVANPTPGSNSGKTATEKASIAEEILRFGGEGTGAGKFKDNRTVAVDARGRIYAADYAGGRIQVFDAAGAFQNQIMSDTSRTVDALAIDRKGNLFVLQGYDVYRFNAETGENLGKYRVDSATDLAIGLDGKLYVPTRHAEIHVFGADGARLKAIRIGKELGLDNLDQIAIDGTGNFFLLDARTAAIFKLSPEGKLVTRFGGRSNESFDKIPNGMFYGKPNDLALDSQGRLYVSQNLRVSVFDENGNFFYNFPTKQAFGMALNDGDELFVASRPFVVKYKLNF